MTCKTRARINRLGIAVTALALSAGVLANESADIGGGKFDGRVVVEWLDDPFVPTMRLVEPFGYQQSQGKSWQVPQGYVIKGRGMPPLFRDLIGQPFNGSFRKAAIVYDHATQEMVDPWDDAQRMFLEASVTEGVERSAWED